MICVGVSHPYDPIIKKFMEEAKPPQKKCTTLKMMHLNDGVFATGFEPAV